jgi:hypothetical protein
MKSKREEGKEVGEEERGGRSKGERRNEGERREEGRVPGNLGKPKVPGKYRDAIFPKYDTGK